MPLKSNRKAVTDPITIRITIGEVSDEQIKSRDFSIVLPDKPDMTPQKAFLHEVDDVAVA